MLFVTVAPSVTPTATAFPWNHEFVVFEPGGSHSAASSWGRAPVTSCRDKPGRA